MHFGFKQQSQFEQQLRSIAEGQIDKALGECGDAHSDFGKVVHTVRRRTKKLRGLVRLVEPHFKSSKQENAAFRDAAAALSATRDAAVMIDTFADLRKHGEGRIAPEDGETLAAFLQEKVGQGPKAAEQQEMLRSFTKAFEDAKSRVKHWSISGHGFDQIGDGLEATYRRTRNAMSTAEDERTPETLHEWRKHTKYHWHHVSLFEKAAPDVLKPRVGSLDKLGELLGDHHNLAVLNQTFETHAEAAEGKAIKAARSAIAERQRVLESAAFALGRQLLAEKPGMLVERFERYWSLLPEKA